MTLNRGEFLRLAGLGSLALMGSAGCVYGTKAQKNVSQKLIKPHRISHKSTLGLVAPASPIYEEKDFNAMLSNLRMLGFNLKLAPHVHDQLGHLAGTDEDRASDLMKMFQDKEVDAIMCIRGGWGCNRILDYLDFNAIKNNPKPLIGFSDITSLHIAIQARTGLVTFHGPVGTSEWNDFTLNSFDKALVKADPQVYEIPAENRKDAYVITPGKAKGKILGGNLTVLTAMMGSAYLPDFDGAILFLEEVGEAVYRVDRMMTQLHLAGVLDKINGFIFGQCTDCKADEHSLGLRRVFKDHIKPLGIPAFYGAMISHEEKNVTIPEGMIAEMDAEKLKFKVSESAVVG